MGRRKTNNLKVICLRLNTAGGVTEYIFGTIVSQKGADFKLKNIIRAICALTPIEHLIQTPTGPQKKIVSEPRFEFHVDNYFTDYESNVLGSTISYWREISSSEDLYETYLNAIDSHRQAQAQLEAQKILKKKQAEIASEKLNREQRRKVAKGSKKKAPRKRAKVVRH